MSIKLKIADKLADKLSIKLKIVYKCCLADKMSINGR